MDLDEIVRRICCSPARSTDDGDEKLALLDVRTEEEYTQYHFDGAVCLPLEELPSLLHELPPTTTPLCIFIGNAAEEESARAVLHRYEVVEVVLLNDEVHEWIVEHHPHVLAKGRACAYTLWTASPSLERLCDRVEELIGYRREECESTDRQPRALDIACGCGRDVVFLARRGWHVLGIDYLQKQVDRVAQLATRSMRDIEHAVACSTDDSVLDEVGVRVPGTNVATLCHDVEKHGLDARFDNQFDLVTFARYLHRPLLAEIPRLLRDGGCVLYHTFMRGSEDTEVGRPRRPQFLLEHGELRALFEATDGMEVLVDEVLTIPDGRPTSLFLARKVQNKS